MLHVSLPGCVTTIGPYCCALDAVSKALSLEETTPGSMLKTSFSNAYFY